MGLLDLLGAFGGKAQTNDPTAAVTQALVGMLAGQSGGASPLNGLISQLQKGGLGEAVNSWIGTGQNQAVSPDQLQQALGDSGHVEQLEQASSLPKKEILSLLATVLPQVIDKLTPNGQVPEAGSNLAGLASTLLSSLGGNKNG